MKGQSLLIIPGRLVAMETELTKSDGRARLFDITARGGLAITSPGRHVWR